MGLENLVGCQKERECILVFLQHNEIGVVIPSPMLLQHTNKVYTVS
jgi:hypothetical protein